MQSFIMLRHLVDEITRFKFDDYRVIRTGASDLKLFVGGVYIYSVLLGSCNTSKVSHMQWWYIKLCEAIYKCYAHFIIL